ncbi:MAG: leucine-rich repeat domain-containing protein [Bacteroidales bacterium]|nr:leucine-rich repeat domain-containing protein [Bacteroidales bacterium]
MKKRRLLCAAAICLAALVSCQKQGPEVPVEPTSQEENQTEPVTPPEEELVVFSASTEAPGTRTTLSHDDDSWHVLWAEGDQININGYTLTLQSENQPAGYGPGCPKGTFVGSNPLPASTSPYYKAIYPATLRDRYGYFNLPAEQPYVEGGIAAFPMYAESDDNNLTFKNLCGIVMLNLKGDKSVTSIALADKDDTPKPMSGRFTVENNAAVLTTGINGTAVVCDTPVALNTDTATPFFLTVPAASYGKLYIIIEASDGTICTLTSNKAINVERSKVTTINLSNLTFKDESAKITYTTSEKNRQYGKYNGGDDASVFGTGLKVVSHSYDSESMTGVITLDGPITTIGNDAFRYGTNNGYIKTVTIPNTVTSVGSYAFYGCHRLESFNFPRGLTTIGRDAFVNCSKFVPDDMSHITSIGEEAFQHIGISGPFTLPEGLTYLGRRAFHDNDGLTEVTITHTPETMGIEIFSSSNNITTVTFADDIDIPNNMFNGCDKLTTINFDAVVTSIGVGAFGSCRALTSLTLPSSVTYIGESAFAYCSGLEEFNFSDNITYIGEGAFSNCTSLETVVLPANLETMYNRYHFSGCTSLRSVTFPTNPNFKTIPYLCFDGCTNLVYTVIPSNVTSISDLAFRNCGFTALPEGWGRRSLYADNTNPYKGCPIESITFPDDWTSVPTSFCWGWKKLKEVNFGSGVTTVGGSAFRECTSLTDGSKVVIPSNVTSIGSYCFHQTGLTSLPSGINRADITISDHAFSNIPLTSVDVSNWTEIPNGVFQECSSLQSATLGSSLTAIKQYAFYLCTSFNSVTLPASLNEMGNYCFFKTALTDIPAGLHDCASFGEHIFGETPMTSITMPDGMTKIPSYMFGSCASLTTVDLNDVTTLGTYAFSSCSSLSSVTAPSVESVGQYAFNNNNALLSIDLPSVKTLASNAFNSCQNLQSVDLGANIQSIGTDCFHSNPSSLVAIYIRNGAAICSLTGRLSGYSLNSALQIFVPALLLDSYKGAPKWIDYKDYIYGIDVPVSMTPITSMKLDDGSVPYYSIDGIVNAFSENGGTLTFLEDITRELTFTGNATGVVDMNGHSTNKVFWMQNTERGTITIRNGTFTQTGDCFDGKTGFSDGYGGTIILENMTVKGTLWTDSHPFIIRSGDYNQLRNMKKNDVTSAGSGTITIEGGRFKSFYNYTTSGWTLGSYTISGGKFAFDPTTATNVTIAEGYSVQTNTDSDSSTYPYIVAPTP